MTQELEFICEIEDDFGSVFFLHKSSTRNCSFSIHPTMNRYSYINELKAFSVDLPCGKSAFFKNKDNAKEFIKRILNDSQ